MTSVTTTHEHGVSVCAGADQPQLSAPDATQRLDREPTVLYSTMPANKRLVRTLPRRHCGALCFLAFLAVLTACSDVPATAPSTSDADRAQPGELVLHVSGAQPTDAAFQLELTGIRAASEVRVSPAQRVYLRQQNDVWHLAVIGTLVDGELVRLKVPDLRDSLRYAARVLDIAQNDGTLRNGDDRATYRISVRRAP